MIGGTPGGDAYYDATTGTHRGPASRPPGGRRSDAVEQTEKATGTARLWLAVALLLLLVALVLVALL